MQDAGKGDYIKIRLYESDLSGSTFSSPTEIGGEMDPFNPTYYSGAGPYDEGDFPGRMGLFWIGRMYVTKDRTKAFFNVMSISAYDGIVVGTDTMNSSGPYMPPTPNPLDFGTSGVTDVQDSRVIQNYIIQADIDAGGNFINLQKLDSTINRGGVNYVCDISYDGTILLVAHMTLDSTFWKSGYGPDGLVLELTMVNPWEEPAWSGYLELIHLP